MTAAAEVSAPGYRQLAPVFVIDAKHAEFHQPDEGAEHHRVGGLR